MFFRLKGLALQKFVDLKKNFSINYLGCDSQNNSDWVKIFFYKKCKL